MVGGVYSVYYCELYSDVENLLMDCLGCLFGFDVQSFDGTRRFVFSSSV